MKVAPRPSPALLRMQRAAVQLDEVLDDRQARARARRAAAWSSASAWRKRSNTCGRNSGLMPMPVSATLISTCEFTRCERRPAPCRRCGVNLIAFESRFQTTCCSRPGSPEIGPASGSSTFSRRMPFASAAGRTVSSAASMNAAGLDRLHVEAQLARGDAATCRAGPRSAASARARCARSPRSARLQLLGRHRAPARAPAPSRGSR